VGDPLEHLHERAEAVAVRGDEHVAAGDELGDDAILPVRLEARERRLERLRAGQRLRRELRVAGVMARMPRIVRLERGRRHVVAAAPDLDLLRAVLRRRFGLVEALQRAVMALAQAPMALDGDPHQLHLVEDQPQRADRADEHGRQRDVEREARLAQRAARVAGFALALLREVDVRPAGEKILEVPVALAVAHQHQRADLSFFHAAIVRSRRKKWCQTPFSPVFPFSAGTIFGRGSVRHAAAAREWRTKKVSDTFFGRKGVRHHFLHFFGGRCLTRLLGQWQRRSTSRRATESVAKSGGPAERISPRMAWTRATREAASTSQASRPSVPWASSTCSSTARCSRASRSRRCARASECQRSAAPSASICSRIQSSRRLAPSSKYRRASLRGSRLRSSASCTISRICVASPSVATRRAIACGRPACSSSLTVSAKRPPDAPGATFGSASVSRATAGRRRATAGSMSSRSSWRCSSQYTARRTMRATWIIASYCTAAGAS